MNLRLLSRAPYVSSQGSRADSGIVKRFHGRKTSFDTDCLVHIIFEILIQRVDAESHPGIGKCFD